MECAASRSSFPPTAYCNAGALFFSALVSRPASNREENYSRGLHLLAGPSTLSVTMAKKKGAVLAIKLLSTAGTGFFYATKKNVKNVTQKLQLMKVCGASVLVRVLVRLVDLTILIFHCVVMSYLRARDPCHSMIPSSGGMFFSRSTS